MKVFRGSIIFDPAISFIDDKHLALVIGMVLNKIKSGNCSLYISIAPFIANARYFFGDFTQVFRISFSQGSLILYCSDESLYSDLYSLNRLAMLNEDIWVDVRVFTGSEIIIDESCRYSSGFEWIINAVDKFYLNYSSSPIKIHIHCVSEKHIFRSEDRYYSETMKALIIPYNNPDSGNIVEYNITRYNGWNPLVSMLDGSTLHCIEGYELTGLETIRPIAIASKRSKPLIYAIDDDILITLTCTPLEVSKHIVETILLYMSTIDEKHSIKYYI